MKKINILYIIGTLEKVGGTERHLAELLKNLDKGKFNCSVCVLNENTGNIVKEIEKHNISIKVIPVRKIYGINAFFKGLKLMRLIKDNHIHIVQTFHFKSDVYGGIIGRLSGVPIIISSRRNMNDLQNRPALLLLNRLVDRLFNKFISVSDAVRDLIFYNENVDYSKSITIYNGVDLNRFPAHDKEEIMMIKKNLNIVPNDLVVGCIANLRQDKNYDAFLKAVAKAVSVRKNIRCLVVGDGPLREELINLCKKNKIDSNVTFTGYRSDIPDILSAIDIFCIVSKNEGFSNAILEAMAMAKPVIATRVGGNKEAVVEQETGILVSPNDTESMSAAILRLCDDSALRERMGLAGRRRIESVFSLQKMIKQMEELYSNLASNGRRHR